MTYCIIASLLGISNTCTKSYAAHDRVERQGTPAERSDAGFADFYAFRAVGEFGEAGLGEAHEGDVLHFADTFANASITAEDSARTPNSPFSTVTM